MSAAALTIGRDGGLFAVHHATANSGRTGVVVLNSGLIGNAGPFRLAVDLAGRLSARGYPVLRLDQSGKGESAAADAGANRTETTLSDLAAAADTLRRRAGVERIVTVGLCSGAYDALIGATLPDLAGTVLIELQTPRNRAYYLHRYLPKLLNVGAWPGMLMNRIRPTAPTTDEAVLAEYMETRGEFDEAAYWQGAEALCQRSLPTLAIFTGDADSHYAYLGQFKAVLRQRGLDPDAVDERYWRDRKHLFPLVQHRRELIETIETWMLAKFDNDEQATGS